MIFVISLVRTVASPTCKRLYSRSILKTLPLPTQLSKVSWELSKVTWYAYRLFETAAIIAFKILGQYRCRSVTFLALSSKYVKLWILPWDTLHSTVATEQYMYLPTLVHRKCGRSWKWIKEEYWLTFIFVTVLPRGENTTPSLLSPPGAGSVRLCNAMETKLPHSPPSPPC
jgi:hypothetical protein